MVTLIILSEDLDHLRITKFFDAERWCERQRVTARRRSQFPGLSGYFFPPFRKADHVGRLGFLFRILPVGRLAEGNTSVCDFFDGHFFGGSLLSHNFFLLLVLCLSEPR